MTTAAPVPVRDPLHSCKEVDAAPDNMEIGVGIARKGWLEAKDVLNAASAEDVIAFARARRTAG